MKIIKICFNRYKPKKSFLFWDKVWNSNLKVWNSNLKFSGLKITNSFQVSELIRLCIALKLKLQICRIQQNLWLNLIEFVGVQFREDSQSDSFVNRCRLLLAKVYFAMFMWWTYCSNWFLCMKFGNRLLALIWCGSSVFCEAWIWTRSQERSVRLFQGIGCFFFGGLKPMNLIWIVSCKQTLYLVKSVKLFTPVPNTCECYKALFPISRGWQSRKVRSISNCTCTTPKWSNYLGLKIDSTRVNRIIRVVLGLFTLDKAGSKSVKNSALIHNKWSII